MELLEVECISMSLLSRCTSCYRPTRNLRMRVYLWEIPVRNRKEADPIFGTATPHLPDVGFYYICCLMERTSMFKNEWCSNCSSSLHGESTIWMASMVRCAKLGRCWNAPRVTSLTHDELVRFSFHSFPDDYH